MKKICAVLVLGLMIAGTIFMTVQKAVAAPLPLRRGTKSTANGQVNCFPGGSSCIVSGGSSTSSPTRS